MDTKSQIQIYGIAWYYFAVFALIVIASAFLGKLPGGMIGAFPLMIVLGAILNKIGDNLPILKTYLGGGAIAAIFGGAAIVAFKLLPDSSIKLMSGFMGQMAFLDFYIAALITGSIMGMDRSVLVRSALRYIPAMIAACLGALALAGIVAFFIGYNVRQAVFFIALPIIGGGLGAGAVPLANIFSQGIGQTPTQILSMMIPALTLGNVLSIVLGGMLNQLGNKFKSLTGGSGADAKLLISNKGSFLDGAADIQKDKIDLVQLACGLLIATTFFALGAIINKFIPIIHSYAWMIFAVALVKVFNLFPQKLMRACYQWFQFIMTNLTVVLLLGIGVGYTDLSQIAAAITPEYIALILAAVVGAILGSAIIGRLVGFYPIDSAITAGLCMTNMGGTGDVAVLSASKRMELMPFAQISSRIGGALILVLASFLIQL